MKLISLVIILCCGLFGFAQSDSTVSGINLICKSIDSKSEVSLYTFSEKGPLPAGKLGYTNVNFFYKVESKSKNIFYIKVNRDNEEWFYQFYYQNGNLIKAIITKYPPSTPTTIFYLWDNNLIAQTPVEPLFWKAFNQLGYWALKKVKQYNDKKPLK